MTRVLLGVDTEADNQWEAASLESLTVRNIAELPRLQKLCDEYGVRPTYLLTQEAAVDSESKAILKELAATGRAEIGTHHHPWTTPPRVNEHLYPLNLTPDHYRAQLRELTQAVAEVAVIGIPDEKYGEQIMAFIVRMPEQDLSEAEIIEFAKSRMTPFKAPVKVKFLDGLPKSLVGKVLKKELRKLV